MNSKSRREGSTIIEVLLATTMFALGMAALMQLLYRGSQTALRAELETMAACRCESIVAKVLTEGQDALPRIKRELAGDPQWDIAISTQSHVSGLLQLAVIVRSRSVPNLGEFELTRLIDSRNYASSTEGVSLMGVTR